MSENLNEQVNVTVDDATVVTVPIDETLSNSGEAADAKAVGDALALKADASSVVAITVNGQTADNQGHIIVDASEIDMSASDSTKVKDAVEAAAGRTGADIPMTSAAGAKKIKAAIEDVDAKTAADITMSDGSSTTIGAKIASMDIAINAAASAASEAGNKTAETILMKAGETQTVSEAMAERVKTVNGDAPDETGNVQVQHALTADNLTSSQSQTSIGEWARRTTGGAASISNGDAWLSGVRGNRVHVSYVEEVINMTVNAAPREEGQTPITATVDRDSFVAAATASGTYNFVYTTSWSVDPSTYGITVTGTPISGDQITVAYTAEDRGTIIQSNPQSLVSTGWNLYNHETGYAIGLKYSNTYGFYIGGTYTAVKYSSTPTGTKTTITPADGYFDIPANGYIWVEGGNTTDTVVYMTWEDWSTEGPETFAAYTESVIDLSDVMETYFPYGLLRVGDIRDEIDFNTGMAISNVQRMAYSAENLAAAIATGRTYEYDTNYIYLERATADSSVIEVEGQYTVNDHGLEYFTDTDLAVYAIVIYGNNLKNKLERDVLTKSADLVDNLTTNDGTKALSAKQGYALNTQLTTQIASVSGNESETGYTIAAKNGCTLNTAKLFWNGKLVTAYIDITIGSTTAIGTQIANGLPTPQGTYDNAVTTISNSNSNDQIQAFTIDGYGDLKIAGKAATASRRYRMTFTYIIN
jgi:hypothetical protein